MKNFFRALVVSYFVATNANSFRTTTKPVTTQASQCNVHNNNYNSFFAGPNCKKIENMFAEVKQQLAELIEEIREKKENETGGTGEKGL